MKFNDKELASVAGQVADKEGRLNHRATTSRSYREKWFKLKGNLLFYYQLNEYGAVANQENPDGVYVIEQCKVELEPTADLPFVFSVVFRGDQDKKHFFSGPTQRHCDHWVRVLRSASYESMRSNLHLLQRRLHQMTGKDPLLAYDSTVQFQRNPKKPLNPAPPIPRNHSAPSNNAWLMNFD